ncbi:hypothetical protein ANTRET_LOCUS1820 [Anthophora retusa]
MEFYSEFYFSSGLRSSESPKLPRAQRDLLDDYEKRFALKNLRMRVHLYVIMHRFCPFFPLRIALRIISKLKKHYQIAIFVLIYLDITIFGVNVFVTGQEIITNNGPFVGGSTCFIKIWLILSSASWELKRDFVKFPVYALVLVFFNKH